MNLISSLQTTDNQSDKIILRIRDCLEELERSKNIRVLYACESGSRAWGFASKDSDYDVRFIYAHPQDWYMSIKEKRDVIERPITDEIDLNGWDLRKALRLLRKSNPPLLEWLQSPIVYHEHRWCAEQLREKAPIFYSPPSCMYHYLHMATGNYREYLRKEIVWLKKYFYVLRPILACKWIESGRGPVPMEFEVLLQEMIPLGSRRNEITRLLERKRNGEELDEGPKVEVINAFLEEEIDHFNSLEPVKQLKVNRTEEIDHLFRSILDQIWS